MNSLWSVIDDGMRARDIIQRLNRGLDPETQSRFEAPPQTVLYYIANPGISHTFASILDQHDESYRSRIGIYDSCLVPLDIGRTIALTEHGVNIGFLSRTNEIVRTFDNLLFFEESIEEAFGPQLLEFYRKAREDSALIADDLYQCVWDTLASVLTDMSQGTLSFHSNFYCVVDPKAYGRALMEVLRSEVDPDTMGGLEEYLPPLRDLGGYLIRELEYQGYKLIPSPSVYTNTDASRPDQATHPR